jgi:HEAT repeat protein
VRVAGGGQPWPELVPLLPQLLEDENVRVRKAALGLLRGPAGWAPSAATLAALARRAADTSWQQLSLWDETIAALASLGERALAELAPELAAQLEGADPAGRAQVAEVVGLVDRALLTERLEGSLEARLRDDDAGVRRAAAGCLARATRPEGRVARLRTVRLLVADPDFGVRQVAIEAARMLGASGGKLPYLDRLAAALCSPEEAVFRDGLEALAALGAEGDRPEVVAALCKAARREARRVGAAVALGRLGYHLVPEESP